MKSLELRRCKKMQSSHLSAKAPKSQRDAELELERKIESQAMNDSVNELWAVFRAQGESGWMA